MADKCQFIRQLTYCVMADIFSFNRQSLIHTIYPPCLKTTFGSNPTSHTSTIIQQSLHHWRKNSQQNFDDLFTAEFLANSQIEGINRVIKYELEDSFKGGLTNPKYQKMTKVSDRTALRDLEAIVALKLLVKKGKKKATRYYLELAYQ